MLHIIRVLFQQGLEAGMVAEARAAAGVLLGEIPFTPWSSDALDLTGYRAELWMS